MDTQSTASQTQAAVAPLTPDVLKSLDGSGIWKELEVDLNAIWKMQDDFQSNCRDMDDVLNEPFTI